MGSRYRSDRFLGGFTVAYAWKPARLSQVTPKLTAMASNPIDNFLAGLTPETRPVAERVIESILRHRKWAVGMKWRQLTFALAGDFDNWVCAVGASRTRVNLVLHYGALLRGCEQRFEPTAAKFVRRIAIESVGDVDDALISDLLDLAVDTLPAFRFRAMRRGLAGRVRRRP